MNDSYCRVFQRYLKKYCELRIILFEYWQQNTNKKCDLMNDSFAFPQEIEVDNF